MGEHNDATGICWERGSKTLRYGRVGRPNGGFYLSILIARMDIAGVVRKNSLIGIPKSSVACFEAEAECQAFPPEEYADKVLLSVFPQCPILHDLRYYLENEEFRGPIIALPSQRMGNYKTLPLRYLIMRLFYLLASHTHACPLSEDWALTLYLRRRPSTEN